MAEHDSDCATFNAPALEPGPCDCDVLIIPPGGIMTISWAPIETAPMDGTEVILYYPHLLDDGFVTAGYWYRGAEHIEPHWYADLVNGGASDPTHWMPLPPPPSETGGE